MKLVEFYKDVITSLGLTVNDEGYVYVGSGDNRMLFHVEGKSLVLPTKEHLATLFEKDDDGNINLVKLPYNPLNEDVVKGDTLSLKKTKVLAERRLGNAIHFAGELLLLLASNPALQKKTSIEINKFLSSLSVAKNQNIKELVDEKSITTWNNLYSKTISADKGVITIYNKKAGVYDGVKYNRLAIISSPLYDELCNYDKETPIYGIKLRAKDATVYKLILKYLLNLTDENSTISIGSNDNESPAFISLYKLYITVANKINSVMNELKSIDTELYDAGIININTSITTLDNLGIHKGELLAIPNENDLNRTKVVEQQVQPAQQQMTQLPVYQQPINIPDMSKPLPYQQEVDIDPIRKILNGNNIPVIPSLQKGNVQQPMYPQQILSGQPMYQQQLPILQQQPMGINNPMQMQQMLPVQQPIYQQQMQPMYQQQAQPMFQQSMYPQQMQQPQMQQSVYQQPMGINSNTYRFN